MGCTHQRLWPCHILSHQGCVDTRCPQYRGIRQKHFQPVPNAIVQRCKFFSRARRPHESIAEYVAQIKQLVEHCKFGEQLNEMLRDRLVCGVAHMKWQQRLLSEEGLTYDKALKLLLAMESAEKEAKDLSGTATGAGEVVHNVHHKRPPPGHYSQHRPQMPACYRCGGNHDPSQCLFTKEECLYCHKRGHIAAVCRQKARNSRQQQPRPTPLFQQKNRRQPLPPHRRGGQRPIHKVEESPEDEQLPADEQVLADEQFQDYQEFPEYHIYNCPAPGSQPLFVELQISNATIPMEVDTGATLSIISRHTYDTVWAGKQAPPIQPTNVKLRTYTREEIPVDGAIEAEVTYQDQKAQLSLVIVSGDGPSLMGRDWICHFEMDWTHLHQVQAKPSSELEPLLDRYKDLFKQELGKIKGITARLYPKAGARPRFYRSRPVPFSI